MFICVSDECVLLLCCFSFSPAFGLVSSVLSQEIGWEECLQNDICVELDVKLCVMSLSISQMLCFGTSGGKGLKREASHAS